MLYMLVTLETSHLDISPLKDGAEKNMLCISVTLDTSHLERSPLNDDAVGTLYVSNKLFISVTRDTSHDPIGPCGPLEQSLGGGWRHCLMATSSSALDFGVHPMVVYYI